jgi:glutamate synthase (NADPH/NADH) small chain
MKFAFMCKEPGSRRGKIAVIGAGPSGLAATGYLSCQGYEVDVYEKLPYAGGPMMFAMPSYRVSFDGVVEGVEDLRDRFSVRFLFRTKVFKNNQNRVDVGDEFVERNMPLEDIIENYNAILISTGAWHPNTIEDFKNTKNAFTAFEYLYFWRLYEEGFLFNQFIKGRRAVVIGEDMLVVESVKKMLEQNFEEIYILHSSNINEAPMGMYWIKSFLNEGVSFIQYTKVAKIVTEQGIVKALEFIKYDTQSSQHISKSIECDLVIASLGSSPTPPVIDGFNGIEIDSGGRIVVDRYFRTKRDKVYASGSVVLGAIYRLGKSFGDGLNAAKNIDIYLQKRRYV